MIVFENAGELDVRAATLIGVNVKESANPVGFFGTGLKYVLACVARPRPGEASPRSSPRRVRSTSRARSGAGSRSEPTSARPAVVRDE